MRRAGSLRPLGALLLVVALTAGCRDAKKNNGGSAAGSDPAAAPAAGDALSAEVLAGLEKYRSLGCACPDLACGDRVQRDLGQWMLSNASRFKDVQGSPAEKAAAKKASAELQKCYQTLQRAAAAPPAP